PRDRSDAATLELEIADLHATLDLPSERDHPLAQRGHEARQVEMAILREVARTRDVHGDSWIKLRGRGSIQHLRFQTDLARRGSYFRFLVESLRRLAQHQHAALLQAEVLLCREFGKEAAAFEIQVAQ